VGNIVTLPVLLVSASQIFLNPDFDMEEMSPFALMFPRRFAGKWGSSTWTNWSCKANSGKQTLHLQYHMRCLSTESNAMTALDDQTEQTGVCIERERTTISGYNRTQPLEITEARVSVGLLTTMRHQEQDQNWSMVTLADPITAGLQNGKPSLDSVHDCKQWDALVLHPCHNFAGISSFQFVLFNQLIEMDKQNTITITRVIE
jgi:hypothetical protein